MLLNKFSQKEFKRWIFLKSSLVFYINSQLLFFFHLRVKGIAPPFSGNCVFTSIENLFVYLLKHSLLT